MEGAHGSLVDTKAQKDVLVHDESRLHVDMAK